ncbi:zinc finger protein 883-like [Lineus longissimus]|uniref:zinc finger protein 883-like n=1 Tax=Lineus longissimus TaxID=88925 RepID=UPI00315DFCD7
MNSSVETVENQSLSAVVKVEPQPMDTASSSDVDWKAREQISTMSEVDSSPRASHSKRKIKCPRKVPLPKGAVTSDIKVCSENASEMGGQDTDAIEQGIGDQSVENAAGDLVGKGRAGTGRRSVANKSTSNKRAAGGKKSKKPTGKRTKKTKVYKDVQEEELSDGFVGSLDSDGRSQDSKVQDKYAGKNPCSVCGKGFRYPSDLRRHSLTHSDQRAFQCDICDLKFRYRSNKVTHMNNKHKTEMVHRCDKCGIRFLTEVDRDYHRLTYSKCKDRGNYRCKYCYQRFARRETLEEHEYCHTGQKPFPCTLCEQRFASLHALKTHKYTHPELGPKPHGCDLCDQRFDRKDRLKKHVAMVHAKNSPFVCEHCNKFFRCEDSLKSHRMTHTNGFRYLCSVCGYGCNWISCFKNHMVMHTGEKKHVCQECSRSFMSSSALKMHMIDHTGDAPHPCSKCPAKFKRLFHLKTHMITHSDARPFKCIHCDKGFKRRDNLEAHILTHSNLKPYHCELCEKQFNNPSNLRMHMSRVHGAKKDFKYERTSKSISKLLGIGEIVKSIEADVTVRQRLAENSEQNSQNVDVSEQLECPEKDQPTDLVLTSNTEVMDAAGIGAESSNVLVVEST